MSWHVTHQLTIKFDKQDIDLLKDICILAADQLNGSAETRLNCSDKTKIEIKELINDICNT